MSKHTPGPWVHDMRGYPHPDVKAVNGRNIACTWGVTKNQPKTKEAYERQTAVARANARLIAAAPELLESLTELLAEVEGCYAASESKARAAIAKATGASK